MSPMSAIRVCVSRDRVLLSAEEWQMLVAWSRRRKTLTLEETPGQVTHWSTRSMALATGMSQSAVSRTWRAFRLKPHAVETGQAVDGVAVRGRGRDVVGLCVCGSA